jgi:hypothetical protein
MAPATQSTVFGLDVRCEEALAFLGDGVAAPTGREVMVTLLEEGAEVGLSGAAERLADERGPDREVVFQIDRHADGYRLGGPRYGETTLNGTGSRARGAPGDGGPEEWQRFLVAQVLPFAAVLQGLEVLHASAVSIAGEAVAMVGLSGAGKTSVALALSREGGEFLADDVLAVERRGERILCHPGAPMAGLESREEERLRDAGGVGLDTLAVNARESVVRVPTAARPVPLAAVFVLDRRPDGPAEPSFEALDGARLLLGSSFNLVLKDKRRLERLLDLFALVSRGRVERIRTDRELDATALAASIAARLGGGP